MIKTGRANTFVFNTKIIFFILKMIYDMSYETIKKKKQGSKTYFLTLNNHNIKQKRMCFYTKLAN